MLKTVWLAIVTIDAIPSAGTAEVRDGELVLARAPGEAVGS